MFRNRIQEAYETLSPRFQRLADYILENTLDVGILTATELARRVSVDPATVVRFAQELGYTGYRELSREIKQYVNEQLALRNRKGTFQQLGFEEKVAQLIDDMSDRLLNMKVDIARFTQVAQAIQEAHHVMIMGTADSFGLALVWSQYLYLIGLPIRCFEMNAVQTALALRDAREGDVIVCIALGLDHGAEESHVLDLAKDKGVTTIAITTNPSSILSRTANMNLSANARTAFTYPSFDTLASALSILWQILILFNENAIKENVNDMVGYVDAVLQQSSKKSRYDSAALKRLWVK
jgi:DNA-binding MurR/RpiR family transcriptional regulator